jgi:acetate kinase
MKILALNTGSSSVKYQLIDTAGGQALARGVVECAGGPDEAIADLLRRVAAQGPIHGAGHRVVHGGERFRASVLIDAEVERVIESFNYLAPLHNPVNLAGIRAVRHALPELPQVAVFDTAFHATVPPAAYTYGLPHDLAEKWKIRRYGFHGTSHRYVSQRCRELMGEDAARRVITLHLGNGCSACAVRDGQAVDSSMGMTPLEGLLMGTRPGDLDPAIPLRLMEWEGWDAREVDHLLNHASGLKGISGRSNDMRELLAVAGTGEARAQLAIDVFCHRIRRYIGAFSAVLNGADAVVFTGGIGENAPEIRARVCAGLDGLGIGLNADLNHSLRGREADLTAPGARVRVWVIPTNEELLIARDTAALLRGR